MRNVQCVIIFMSKVLLIFTGGTISMVRNKATGALYPADMETFKAFMPELFSGDINIEVEAFDPLLDSSDVIPTIGLKWPIWSMTTTIDMTVLWFCTVRTRCLIQPPHCRSC